MDKRNITDEKLEELIKQLPDVTSSVAKEQFRSAVMMEVNRQQATKIKSNKLFYSLASAGFLTVIGIVGLNLFDNDEEESKTQQFAGIRQVEERKMEDVNEEKMDIIMNSVPESLAFSVQEYSTLAVFDKELPNNQTFIEYHVLDESISFVVPLTLAVEKEEGLTEFDLFMKYQESFDESQWRLAETYPLPHKLTIVDNSLHIDVEEKFPQSLGTAGEGEFFTLANYFSEEYDFNDVKFFTEGKAGIAFSHVGELLTNYSKEGTGIHAYYLYYPTDDRTGKPLLAQRFGYTQTIDEAFELMYQDSADYRVYSAFPKELQFYSIANDKTLEVIFTNGISYLQEEQYWYTIDVILAVAKSAGFEGVKFSGLEINQVGNYNLTNIIPVPSAYNQIVW